MSKNNSVIMPKYCHFEEEYKALLQKPAPKEDFVRILYAVDLDMFYNFEFVTPHQKGSFYIVPPLGDINALWKFLEDLASGKELVSFSTDYEYQGTEGLLLAKQTDKDNLRVTIICNAALEIVTRDDNSGISRSLHQRRFAPKVTFDAVLNKRHFIYTFYMALTDIFGVHIFYDKKPLRFCYDKEEAKTDSAILKNYFRFRQARPIDKELFNKLLKGTVSETKSLLKQGANPNAILETCKNNFWANENILQRFWRSGLDGYNGNEPNYEEEYKGKNYNSEIENFMQKNDLLFRYGATPRSEFYLFYAYGYPLPKEETYKIFKSVFDRHCYIRYDFWYYVVCDTDLGIDYHNKDLKRYEPLVTKALWREPDLLCGKEGKIHYDN